MGFDGRANQGLRTSIPQYDDEPLLSYEEELPPSYDEELPPSYEEVPGSDEEGDEEADS